MIVLTQDSIEYLRTVCIRDARRELDLLAAKTREKVRLGSFCQSAPRRVCRQTSRTRFVLLQTNSD
jgi:hypothetical protein